VRGYEPVQLIGGIVQGDRQVAVSNAEIADAQWPGPPRNGDDVLLYSAALAATWVMQVTTHQAGLGSSIAQLALAQRIALAALAIFLMLNAVTPFITPDPPWLTNLPLVVAIMAFLLAFGLSHIRAERARGAEALKATGQQ